MSKIAFIYPGQGAQAIGMGKDFYEKSPLSRTIFDQASEAVNLDLKKLCFEENDLLDKTEYTQVAMVTACLAMTRAVESMGLHADIIFLLIFDFTKDGMNKKWGFRLIPIFRL